jgi:hypothetical protein
MQAVWKGYIRPPCTDRTFADAAAVKDMQFAGAGVEIEADAQYPAIHFRARVSPRDKNRLLEDVTLPEVEAFCRSSLPVLKTKGLEEGIGAAASAREQGPGAWKPGKSPVCPGKLRDKTGSLKPARAVSAQCEQPKFGLKGG